MKKLIFGMLTALVACTSWATASVTWSLGGAADGEPAAGVWVGNSEEEGEQIMSGHLYLCFTPAGEGSQMENWITLLTTSYEGGGLDGAGVSAMNTFLKDNSQWNGYNDGKKVGTKEGPNFSANVYSGTGGAFGTPPAGQDNPSPVNIDGIEQDGSYDVVAVIFDTEEITSDSRYAVIKGYGEKDFYMQSAKGQLECGFGSEWFYGEVEHGQFAPNNAVDGQWHTVGNVPEPTSGLLLLLGVAGLALGRPASRKRYAVTSKRA